jgi:hypothetical protein
MLWFCSNLIAQNMHRSIHDIIKRLRQKGVALGSELEEALGPPKEEALAS